MNKKALELIDKINSFGFVAYLVGGYPRDMYLNRTTYDIDVCTNATPKDLKNIFGNSMLSKINYGSVVVVYKNVRFEITTFRKDLKYINNRLPVKFEYVDNLLDDLKRRDFTINTLCIDANGVLIDLLDGRKDIDNKIIKMVGDPSIRLKEDCLRILRAIRFATILNFKLDDELKKYISKYGYLLKKLSYDRKKSELDKIFSSNNVAYGIELIKELGLDKPLELNFDNLVITNYPIGIWAQINPSNYKFSKNEKDMIKKIKELKDKDIFDSRIMYEYDLFLLSAVADIRGISKRTITYYYNKLPIKSRKDIAISPGQICELLNKKSGPFLKKILDNLENEILSNNLNNEYNDIKNYILDKYKNI